MTQTTILPGGDRAQLLSPEHRMLRRMAAATIATYYPAQAGASVTQLRAAARKGLVALVRGGHGGFEVLGAHLTAQGEAHLAELDAAAEHAAFVARRVAGDLS